jgi:Ni/Co efflux regulator RcnB
MLVMAVVAASFACGTAAFAQTNTTKKARKARHRRHKTAAKPAATDSK